MMDQRINTDPRAWAVATALGLESRLDCALWASGELAAADAREAMREKFVRDSIAAGASETWADRESRHAVQGIRIVVVPVPAPWDADAYRADCVRRGVEPGPLPSLRHTGADGLGWSVHVVRRRLIAVRFMSAGEDVAVWYSDCDSLRIDIDTETMMLSRGLVARIVTLATVAWNATERGR